MTENPAGTAVQDVPPIASDMRISPCTLGERQFVGPDYAPRVIAVDLVAGTLGVQARFGKPRHVFAWCVPHVPLSTLTPLLDQLLTHVRAALPGASFQANPAGELLAVFDPDGEAHLQAADALVNAFYRRWTGRSMTSARSAECVGCNQPIFNQVNVQQGLWLGADQGSACPAGGFHRPHPQRDHPKAPIRHVPGHARKLTESGGLWTGACGCGEWDFSDPDPDWHEVAVAWYLHAEAVPPGAPFDD